MTASQAPGATSIRVALPLPFAAAELAPYLLQPDVLGYWVGRDAVLGDAVGSAASLPTWTLANPGPAHFGAMSQGTVVRSTWPGVGAVAGKGPFELVVGLTTPAPQRLSLRLSVCGGGTSRLRLQHEGLADPRERRASLKLWQGALRRLERLMRWCRRNLRRERQAVILVHGIGEQRPGELLREFVANVFDGSRGERYHLKPDLVSSLFELRLASVPRVDRDRPTTDIYELYWAHLIRDTTVAQVYGWLLRLLLSRDGRIPPTLRRLVWIVRILLVAGAAGFAWLATKDVSAWLKTFAGGALVALPGALTLGWTALRDQFLVNFAGDAARYLEPRAENIARRQEIREAGSALLEALHAKRRYARIVVYGHSLGSVIAYDILGHAWARHSRMRDPVARTSSRALRALEALVDPHTRPAAPPAVDVVQSMQREAWDEYRRNGFQWRVSDFVSAGSPLAHARWLLAADATHRFEDLVRERSLPTCPPQTEQIVGPATVVTHAPSEVFTFTHAYTDRHDPHGPRARRSVQVPHHGGLFALTRWTNLYFPYRGFVDGDPVAGPLAPHFGAWVKDVRLPDTQGFAHTRYTSRLREPQAVAALRDALHLPMRGPLSDYSPPRLHPTTLD